MPDPFRDRAPCSCFITHVFACFHIVQLFRYASLQGPAMNRTAREWHHSGKACRPLISSAARSADVTWFASMLRLLASSRYIAYRGTSQPMPYATVKPPLETSINDQRLWRATVSATRPQDVWEWPPPSSIRLLRYLPPAVACFGPGMGRRLYLTSDRKSTVRS